MIVWILTLACYRNECAGLDCAPADPLVVGDYVASYGDLGVPEGAPVEVTEAAVTLEYEDEDGNRWRVRWPITAPVRP